MAKEKKEEETKVEIVPMGWFEYAQAAMRTVPEDYLPALSRMEAVLGALPPDIHEKSKADRTVGAAMLHTYMGVITEIGEFVDLLKKPLMYGKKEVDVARLVDEAGDACWYIAVACFVDGDRHREVDVGRIDSLVDLENSQVSKLTAFDAFHILVTEHKATPEVKAALAVRIASLLSGESPDVIRGRNIAKLKIRMPEAFDGDKAQNKSDDDEKEAFADVGV